MSLFRMDPVTRDTPVPVSAQKVSFRFIHFTSSKFSRIARTWNHLGPCIAKDFCLHIFEECTQRNFGKLRYYSQKAPRFLTSTCKLLPNSKGLEFDPAGEFQTLCQGLEGLVSLCGRVQIRVPWFHAEIAGILVKFGIPTKKPKICKLRRLMFIYYITCKTCPSNIPLNKLYSI